ncbi:MAG: hypothetical protein GF418_11285, partial [Chitinivibrionales bacterium]|nr:hypothetical protein [Chitinivibrionales bacterium]MBD3396198.1 hypothetical protein [Chitinivibrionales bacterium]
MKHRMCMLTAMAGMLLFGSAPGQPGPDETGGPGPGGPRREEMRRRFEEELNL